MEVFRHRLFGVFVTGHDVGYVGRGKGAIKGESLGVGGSRVPILKDQPGVGEKVEGNTKVMRNPSKGVKQTGSPDNIKE